MKNLNKERWVCWSLIFVCLFGMIYISECRQRRLKNLFLGYLDKMEVAKTMKSDPNFDYDKFETNLNQFMKNKLK